MASVLLVCCFVLCLGFRPEDLDQPLGFGMAFASCLFKNAAVLVNVAKVLSDLDEPDVLVAGDVGAVHLGIAALAVVALSVPAVEGEAYALGGLREVGFKILAGNGGVVLPQVEFFSHLVSVSLKAPDFR